MSEIFSVIENKEKQITCLKQEIEHQYNKMVELLPFKVGDKIRIIRPAVYRDADTIGWVTKIRFNGWSFSVNYNPPKKNGERSHLDKSEPISLDPADRNKLYNCEIEILEPAP